MKSRLYLPLVAVALLCLAGWKGYGQAQKSNPMRQTWEYRVADAYNDPTQAQQMLNQHGAEGWEFVGRSGNYCYFKRPK